MTECKVTLLKFGLAETTDAWELIIGDHNFPVYAVLYIEDKKVAKDLERLLEDFNKYKERNQNESKEEA